MCCFSHSVGSESLSSPVMSIFHIPFHLLTFLEERPTGCGKSFERDDGPALAVGHDLFEEYMFFETHFRGRFGSVKPTI